LCVDLWQGGSDEKEAKPEEKEYEKKGWKDGKE